MNQRGRVFITKAGALLLVTLWAVSCAYAGTAEVDAHSRIAGHGSVIYNFADDAGGYWPSSNLSLDSYGNLYGVNRSGGAMQQGVIFELVRQPGGTWTQKVLYTFTGGADGGYPLGDLTFDEAGNLYGVANTVFTQACLSDCSGVFQLTPEPDGTWQETLLYIFPATLNFGFNVDPNGGLALDALGNLYGTTKVGGEENCNGQLGCGTVFELSPQPDGTWTETTIYGFLNGSDGALPNSNLIMDANGDLYGTTMIGAGGPGTVFKLSKGANGWAETVIYSFDPSGPRQPGAGVIFGPQGSLYGTTQIGGACQDSQCGTIFQLAPQADGSWTETTLYRLNIHEGQFPARVASDTAGNLFTTAQTGGRAGVGCGALEGSGCGTVFELKAASDGSWTGIVLHSFRGIPDGLGPEWGVALGGDGVLYGTTFGGGRGGACGTEGLGCGTIFMIKL